MESTPRAARKFRLPFRRVNVSQFKNRAFHHKQYARQPSFSCMRYRCALHDDQRAGCPDTLTSAPRASPTRCWRRWRSC